MLRMVRLPDMPLDGNQEEIEVTEETEMSNEVKGSRRLSQPELDEVHALLEHSSLRRRPD
jgi:hypothetical protein